MSGNCNMQHQEIAQHIVETGKVVAGGVVTAGTTYATFSLAELAQYSSIAAAIATTIYFLTMTAIGVLKYKKNKGA